MMRNSAVLAAAALALGLVAPAAPARALDLETALREVAAHSPTLAARQAMTEAARRRIAPAGAWSSPMLELGAVNVPTSGRFDEDPMTMRMLGVSQRVPVFGANRLARRSAAAAFDAEAAGAAMTRYQVLGRAWESYAAGFYAAEMSRQADAHQAIMDRLVQSARARYESGRGRLEDVLRAEAERARVLADLAGFRAEERGARAQLDALRGDERASGSEALAAPPAAPVPAEANAWLAAVNPSHPRLRELDAQVNRYRFAARAARRVAWPDMELRGSYGNRDQTVGESHGTPELNDMFSATVGFMVPIFAGQRELSEAAEMDAMARASESERRAAELDIRQGVLATWAAAAAAQRTVSLLADTVVTTQRRAVDASWTSYSAGATDLWRVFEASHALYAEEIALLRARQDLARAQAQFVSLTGRGDLLGVTLPTTTGGER